jgi:hypothetical protein
VVIVSNAEANIQTSKRFFTFSVFSCENAMQDAGKACKFWKLKKGNAIFLLFDHFQIPF